MIYSITLYTKKNNKNNPTFVQLLSERFQCEVKLNYRKDIFNVSVWCDNAQDEQKMQKRVEKYFKQLKKQYS